MNPSELFSGSAFDIDSKPAAFYFQGVDNQ